MSGQRATRLQHTRHAPPAHSDGGTGHGGTGADSGREKMLPRASLRSLWWAREVRGGGGGGRGELREDGKYLGAFCPCQLAVVRWAREVRGAGEQAHSVALIEVWLERFDPREKKSQARAGRKAGTGSGVLEFPAKAFITSGPLRLRQNFFWWGGCTCTGNTRNQ